MFDKLRASLGTLVAQLFFIAAGVYLGNQADDWKQEREHQRAARAALTNFAAEIRRNRDRLLRTHAAHVELRDNVAALMERPAPPRTIGEMFEGMKWRGLNPATFRHAAWQLALGNQSLGYLDPSLAFAIADVYQSQEALERYGDVTTQNVVNPQAMRQEDPRPMGMTIQAYVVDAASYQEPQILAAYDRLLPRIDSAVARLPK